MIECLKILLHPKTRIILLQKFNRTDTGKRAEQAGTGGNPVTFLQLVSSQCMYSIVIIF